MAITTKKSFQPVLRKKTPHPKSFTILTSSQKSKKQLSYKQAKRNKPPLRKGEPFAASHRRKGLYRTNFHHHRKNRKKYDRKSYVSNRPKP
jgi:hypothetical protein